MTPYLETCSLDELIGELRLNCSPLDTDREVIEEVIDRLRILQRLQRGAFIIPTADLTHTS